MIESVHFISSAGWNRHDCLDPDTPNKSWVSSKYDIEGMHWTELQQKYFYLRYVIKLHIDKYKMESYPYTIQSFSANFVSRNSNFILDWFVQAIRPISYDLL
jgi:hypothetical protein